MATWRIRNRNIANMKPRFRKIKDGLAIELKLGSVLNLACCDCGLVHRIGIAGEENGKIGLAFKQNRRLTKQRRSQSRIRSKLRNLARLGTGLHDGGLHSQRFRK